MDRKFEVFIYNVPYSEQKITNNFWNTQEGICTKRGTLRSLLNLFQSNVISMKNKRSVAYIDKTIYFIVVYFFLKPDEMECVHTYNKQTKLVVCLYRI